MDSTLVQVILSDPILASMSGAGLLTILLFVSFVIGTECSERDRNKRNEARSAEFWEEIQSLKENMEQLQKKHTDDMDALYKSVTPVWKPEECSTEIPEPPKDKVKDAAAEILESVVIEALSRTDTKSTQEILYEVRKKLPLTERDELNSILYTLKSQRVAVIRYKPGNSNVFWKRN